MRNASLTKNSGHSAVLRLAKIGVFSVFFLLQFLSLDTPAQDFLPEKFDKALIEESLRDQEILREEMLLEQEILREEMEQIRLEIQRIMREITASMKGEAQKLQAELEGLKEETQRIQQEILATLQKSKQDFIEGQGEMRKELQKMRQEAKAMTEEIQEVLQEQKQVWQQETAALQGSLVDARKEMNAAKVNAEEALQSSRSAITDFKKEKEMTMADSRAKSDMAMSEAGEAFQESQNDYKIASSSITKELMADMKEIRENMQKRQTAQKRDSENTQHEVLAALQTAKNQRLKELTRDAARQKLQKKKNIRAKELQTRKKEQTAKVEKRKALVRKPAAKTPDKKRKEKQKTERQKEQKKSALIKKKAEKQRETKKAKKTVTRKSDSRPSPKAIEEDSVLTSPQGRPAALKDASPGALDKEIDAEFGRPDEKKRLPVPVEEDEKLVIVADIQAKTAEEPLQEKVSGFSKNITNLKTELKKESGNPGALLVKLGDAYLEAQRFISSQKDAKDRQKILALSENQEFLLGSYEQAVWAYKLSLTFNHKSAETHFKVGKLYDEMGDGINALMHAKLALQIFKRHDNSRQMEETLAFIETLTKKYKTKSEKNNA